MTPRRIPPGSECDARGASHEVDLEFSYSRHRPVGRAGVLVEDYWEVRAASCRTAVEAALPDTTAEIYFNLGPGGRQVFDGPSADRPAPRAAWVMGPRIDPLLVAKETHDCDIVGVRLHPGVAGHVLGAHARDLAGTLVDLDQLWGPGPPWAQVAIQSGFCDQAHMIHDFRRLTGLTPREYSERRTRVRVGFVPYRLAEGG